MATAPTIDAIYLAVTDPDVGATYPEAIADAIGTDDVDAVRELVSSMLVSKFLVKTRGGDLRKGPTPLAVSPTATTPPRSPVRGTSAAALGVPLADKLRLARRVQLQPGQALTGSAAVNDGEGGIACVAGVSGRYGPTVLLGVPIANEDKTSWRGANLGSTVPLSSADVDLAVAELERVVADGKASQPHTKDLWDREQAAYDEMERLQRARYATAAAAEEKIAADAKVQQETNIQASRLRTAQPAVRNLDPALRAQYDDLERQWREACDRDRQWAIREQQGVLVTGLSLEELRELYDLDTDYAKQRAHKARYEQLLDRPSNVQGRSSRACTQKNRWLDMIRIHHGCQDELIELERHVAGLEANARPLDAGERERLDAAIAVRRALEEELDSILGWPVVTAEVPTEWGALVVQCYQDEEELTLSYKVAVRPASADPEEWDPAESGDPWTPKPAQLRKLAATLGAMRDSATTAGDRRPPAGVVPFAT